MSYSPLFSRAYNQLAYASSWEEIWEAGPYYTRISELLEHATDYAIFVGWQIDSRLPLTHDASPLKETLKEKAIRLCCKNQNFQIYFLMWDYAYFYAFERELWQWKIWGHIHKRIHFIFDSRHPLGGSHHEKLCIIDGKIAFCGGIDLCDERWDSPQHLYNDPRRSLDGKKEHHGPYHDIAVQVTGPICVTLQTHIAQRWQASSRIPLPQPPSFLEKLHLHDDGHQVSISRTIANTQTGKSVREIEFLFRDLIQSAQHLILMEGQYYWSKTINDFLINKFLQMRGKDFRVIIILSEPEHLKALTHTMALHQLNLLKELKAIAQATNVRLVIGTPFTKDPCQSKTPRPIYIHSKLLLIDEHYLSIGSANFANRALRLDSEIQLTLIARNEGERAHIRRVGNQILQHWNCAELDSNTPDTGRTNNREIMLRSIVPELYLKNLQKAHTWHHGTYASAISKHALEGIIKYKIKPRLAAYSTQWPFALLLPALLDPPVPWFFTVRRRLITSSASICLNCFLLFSISSLVWNFIRD